MPTLEADPTHSRVIRKRHRPRAKLNEAKIIELAEAGLNATDIAKHQGVHVSSTWRFLKDHNLRKRSIEQFKSHRADLLAGLQGDCLELQAKIVRSINDGVIVALKQHEKTGLLMALNATHGTSFEKERLERGESTANHSIVSTMVDNRVGKLYKAPQVIDSKSSRTPTSGV